MGGPYSPIFLGTRSCGVIVSLQEVRSSYDKEERGPERIKDMLLFIKSDIDFGSGSRVLDT